MRADIHPKYEETKYTCACGAEHQSQSVMGGVVKIEICSSCHPLYTGKDKIVDTEGRIDRFRKKYQKK